MDTGPRESEVEMTWIDFIVARRARILAEAVLESDEPIASSDARKMRTWFAAVERLAAAEEPVEGMERIRQAAAKVGGRPAVMTAGGAL